MCEVDGVASSPAHHKHEAVDNNTNVEEPVEDAHEVSIEDREVADTADPGAHHQHREALVEAEAGVHDDNPVQEGLALLPEDEIDEAAVGGDDEEDGEPLHQLHCLHRTGTESRGTLLALSPQSLPPPRCVAPRCRG